LETIDPGVPLEKLLFGRSEAMADGTWDGLFGEDWGLPLTVSSDGSILLLRAAAFPTK
jgi:hypothetical protein